MLDFLIELIGDIFGAGAEEVIESGVEAIADTVTDIDWGSLIDGVISTSLLVAGTIAVASITENAIREQMRNRAELKNKGVKSAVVKVFIEQAGYTEITLAALNAQNQQVGTFKMKSKSVSGVKKGMKISA